VKLPVLLRTLLALAASISALSASTIVSIELPDPASPRVRYAAERLSLALPAEAPRIVLAVSSEVGKPEGFLVRRNESGPITITGADESGLLYGCLELASLIRKQAKVPETINLQDAPVFVLRGPCIGMQKTYYLPGRKVYEYPYTPEEFPFFYDKGYWKEYLDHLVDLRMNTLYLWNGHPFASLVRLPEYPEAVEVSAEVFARNVEMFRWLTEECDRRGIWLVQQFYSILISKPLAEKHGLDSQLHAWNDLAADYTRKSIAAFVREFPHVGLMPCLGEALQEQKAQTRWMTEVILPGVKDGMKAADLTEEPPVVLRTHATDATQVMPEALKVYGNLYTEAKFNGESLTTWEPRGVRQDLHLTMSRVGSRHIANVHILANLEPFRYGATEFIRKSVLAMRDRLGASGLHLYPLYYWPVSPDITPVPLKQWERDWLWFEAWARYAWNPDLDPASERAHWIARLAEHFGSEAAEDIFVAYNESGECAPRILRRFGITEGNRQTMALGMTLDQLVRPEKYREFPELWESQSPPGERLKEFAERAWNRQPHEGETPVTINAEVLDHSARAVEAVDAAASAVTHNHEEFARLRNDVHAIRAMSLNYVAKTEAAMAVLRFERSKDLADMERAERSLEESLEHFRKLTALTKDTYTAANSMQTAQRRVPVPGGKGGKAANYHWTHLLPIYEQELADFRAQVAALKDPASAKGRTHAPLTPAKWKLVTPGLGTYTVQVGNTVFADSPATFTSVAPELEGLQGIGIRMTNTLPIEFEASEPVRVLVGYFNATGPEWRTPPTLETDATAAERGGAEPFIVDAVKFDQLPSMTVHAFEYPAGRHTLEVRNTGAYVILGIVKP
jgi:hypothetical protein